MCAGVHVNILLLKSRDWAPRAPLDFLLKENDFLEDFPKATWMAENWVVWGFQTQRCSLLNGRIPQPPLQTAVAPALPPHIGARDLLLIISDKVSSSSLLPNSRIFFPVHIRFLLHYRQSYFELVLEKLRYGLNGTRGFPLDLSGSYLSDLFISAVDYISCIRSGKLVKLCRSPILKTWKLFVFNISLTYSVAEQLDYHKSQLLLGHHAPGLNALPLEGMKHGMELKLFPWAAEFSLSTYLLFFFVHRWIVCLRWEVESEILKYHYNGTGTALYLSDTICWPASSNLLCDYVSSVGICLEKQSGWKRIAEESFSEQMLTELLRANPRTIVFDGFVSKPGNLQNWLQPGKEEDCYKTHLGNVFALHYTVCRQWLSSALEKAPDQNTKYCVMS